MREGKDMLRGDRNVGVVRKAGVTRGNGDDVSERNARRDDRDWGSTTTLPEAGALRASLWGRFRARRRMVRGRSDWSRAGVASVGR